MAVACAQDAAALAAVAEARQRNIAEYVLIGERAGILATAEAAGVAIDETKILDEGVMVTPEPSWNLELAVKLCVATRLRAQLRGAPEDRIELLRIFEKFKVMPIAAVGRPFNPEYHEAILREESDEFAENTVLREMQKGYMIGSRLLRPALVVVAAPRDAARQSA